MVLRSEQAQLPMALGQSRKFERSRCSAVFGEYRPPDAPDREVLRGAAWHLEHDERGIQSGVAWRGGLHGEPATGPRQLSV